MIKILIDGFGGDNAPLSNIMGACLALKEFKNIEIFISGNANNIISFAKRNNLDISNLKIYDIEKTQNNSDINFKQVGLLTSQSMAYGLKALKEEKIDAFISAGNTGELVVGACTIVGRIEKVRRAALCPLIPSLDGKVLLIDAGANLKYSAKTFLSYGIMGSTYAEKVLKVKNPKIGLANVGIEKFKGTDAHRQGYELLKKCSYINFIGNVEARDILMGVCNVVVADGFAGNMILKTIEGCANFFKNYMKNIINTSVSTKIAGLILKKHFIKYAENLDCSSYGGAILLGISKPIIKAHGNSDAIAIKNAVKQAIICIDEKITANIYDKLRSIELNT